MFKNAGSKSSSAREKFPNGFSWRSIQEEQSGPLRRFITTPIGKGFRSVNVYLRQALNLYACVRPCKSYPGVRGHYKNVNLVVIRENTGATCTLLASSSKPASPRQPN